MAAAVAAGVLLLVECPLGVALQVVAIRLPVEVSLPVDSPPVECLPVEVSLPVVGVLLPVAVRPVVAAAIRPAVVAVVTRLPGAAVTVHPVAVSLPVVTDRLAECPLVAVRPVATVLPAAVPLVVARPVVTAHHPVGTAVLRPAATAAVSRLHPAG